MSNMSVIEMLQIIAEQEQNEIRVVLMWICLASLAIGFLVVLMAVASDRVRKLILWLGPIGCAMVLPGIIKLYAYGSTKPPSEYPQITWDTGLYNNGSTFDTNTWKTIHFRWTKGPQVIGTDAVYFAAKHRDYPELEWSEIGQSTAGQLSWDYTFTGTENATNYLYYAFMLGEVHTNGVWLGTVLQKATPGNCGPDKMVIIKGKLDVNGKVIAPFKE